MALVALSATITMVVAALAWSNSRLARQVTVDLTSTTVAVRDSMMADMMHDAIRADVFGAKLAALAQDAKGAQEAEKDFEEHITLMKESVQHVLRAELPSEVLVAVKQAASVVDNYGAQAISSMKEIKANPQDAAAAIDRFLVAFGETEAALEKSGEAIEKAAEQIKEETQATLARTEAMTAAVIAVCLLVLLGIAAVVIRSIMTPILNMHQAVSNLNSDDGDLSRRLPPAIAEFGEVAVLFNRFLDKVAAVVGRVQDSARQISVTSAQIASGNMDLSQRTEHTAAALQQAASSMEEITATVQQSAESARQASEYAVTASDVAARGGEAVSRVVATMDEINVASRKISDIIAVIDGIAFQTNILALNAAVEAARAGEQGRGFAVVAAEVRSLAQRSAEAAREIKALIGSSVEKVDAGTALVRNAGATMDEIVASVGRVSTMIQEITHAATEQNTGISLINETVVELDKNTQKNTALVEETAAVANEMADQAAVLEKTVSVFKASSAVA
jgi:methyl-accepting chemotaxis protein